MNPLPSDGSRRRDAVLIVEAERGFRAQAYSLIRRAVRESGLKVTAFIPLREGRSYGLAEARFIIECTDEEADRLRSIGNRLAAEDGWERWPVDMYHD